MIKELLHLAENGSPLWITEVESAFAADEGCRRAVLSLVTASGARRDFALPVPCWADDEERSFVKDFLCARVFNVLSALGGRELCFYLPEDAEVSALFTELPAAFQLDARVRHGLGKCISVSERISRAFGGNGVSFSLRNINEYTPADTAPEREYDLGLSLRSTAEKAEKLCLCGIDVGGTDIKLAVSKGKRLIAVKEYDWNPALCTRAEGLIGPIELLLRLMRCCAAVETLTEPLSSALRKDASDEEMQNAVAQCEAALGERINVLDGIGVSYPDVVIRDLIVGGETPKTNGIRNDPTADYEAEFAQLTALKTRLLKLCRDGGSIRMTNDGNMAAYTAAMELAHSEDGSAAEGGVFAHTLGTDLGSGWLCADGSIPEMPLELYDLLFDLGSFPQRRFPAGDLRSTGNENSGLSGARRYMGQAAAYRMAYELDSTLLDGFTEEHDGILSIRMQPHDLRKPCLEHLMRLAAEGNENAAEIFRNIGRHLGYISLEAEKILLTGTGKRYVFGRFVKMPACFALIREGCAAVFPELIPEPADEDMAFTALMKELSERDDVTVAQFGQAIGAIYFALSRER